MATATTTGPVRPDLPAPRQVLVPLDESTVARRPAGVAEELAGRFSAELAYLTVVADEPQVAEALEGLQARVEGSELPDGATSVTVGDDPAATIVERAGQDEALVVLSTHGRGRVAGSLLGSVAEQVVREAGAPVVVVGPRTEGRSRWRTDRLVVCLDGSAAAEAILPLAASWARTLQVPIELVHVVHPEAFEQFAVNEQHADVLESNDLARVARRLRAPGVSVEWDVLHDAHAAAAIVRHLEARPHSLVLLTTHSRRGLARLTLGSVAAELVRSSPTPLVLLHPSGV